MKEEYINQDLSNPKYLFHGSSKLLKEIEPKQSEDSSGNKSNIDTAIFLTSDIIIASAYSFMHKIEEESIKSNKNPDFIIDQRKNNSSIKMKNIKYPKELEGYIYVFENNNNFVHENINSLQYKSYKKIKPIDVIKTNFNDYKKFYDIEKEMKILINKNYLEYEPQIIYTYIKDINFLKKHNYNFDLPKELEFNSLIKLGETNQITEKQIPNIKEKFQKIANKEFYNNIYSEYENDIIKTNKILDNKKQELIKLEESWDFKIYNEYILNLTNYGSGGMYDYNEKNGIITLKINQKNPIETIIHELVHIGIEEAIIKKYNIGHIDKEYIVDILTKSIFKEYFPDYKVQSINPEELTPELKEEINEDYNWEELEEFLKKIYKEKEIAR